MSTDLQNNYVFIDESAFRINPSRTMAYERPCSSQDGLSVLSSPTWPYVKLWSTENYLVLPSLSTWLPKEE
ncbi:hypothetical protein G6F56_006055 [Rhizopus delemar]|nr:hypothetical protein G6F56_006055 [Rhizopus delemar]